jgi:hypothetical protein
LIKFRLAVPNTQVSLSISFFSVTLGSRTSVRMPQPSEAHQAQRQMITL